MTRVKKAMNALKARKNILKRTKGYRFGRSNKEREAMEAIFHAGTYAFAHRKDKKSDMRKLWTVKINAALNPKADPLVKEFSYSKFMGAMKKKNILVDRKILAHLAEFHPETFQRVVAKVK
jgi:large subunit ribosomal protein L20